ncbi:MAG TPA: acyloxyacyl hydrolase [Thiobacillus sp.]|nr:acyloxyacyl hydrolase [Thiobacillus sp.]
MGKPAREHGQVVGAGIARTLGAGLAIAIGLLAPIQATLAGNTERRLAIGVLAHDRGLAADHHEDGIDLNVERLFTPLDLPGSPRPHIGITLNFVGDTSMAYAGLSFRYRETARWFVDVLLSAAIHDGPLHKDPEGCRRYSDCGFGIRAMPRFGLEIGYRVSPDAFVTLFHDHMSHKWVIGGENEGIDHLGLRYIRPY